MGAFPIPWRPIKRFAQAFRASKRGLKPSQFVPPTYPAGYRLRAENATKVREAI